MVKVNNVEDFQKRFSTILGEVKECVDSGDTRDYVMFEYVEEILLFFELINNDTLTEESKIHQYNNHIENIWKNLILED